MDKLQEPDDITLAFQREGRYIPIKDILPTKPLKKNLAQDVKYTVIQASIADVGVIEPPLVWPIEEKSADTGQQYSMVDGHLRLRALQEMGATEVFCFLATDDETFLCNHSVNRLTVIQEHFMILRAIEKGLSAERVARALKVKPDQIRERCNLLQGICPEAIELLKDTPISAVTLRMLRKVKPLRQIEIAQSMLQTSTFSPQYIQLLIGNTEKELCTESHDRTANVSSPEELARLQRELDQSQLQLQSYEDNYASNIYLLIVAQKYLTRLLQNERVERYLRQHHAEMLEQLQQVMESASLEG